MMKASRGYCWMVVWVLLTHLTFWWLALILWRRRPLSLHPLRVVCFICANGDLVQLNLMTDESSIVWGYSWRVTKLPKLCFTWNVLSKVSYELCFWVLYMIWELNLSELRLEDRICWLVRCAKSESRNSRAVMHNLGDLWNLSTTEETDLKKSAKGPKEPLYFNGFDSAVRN